MHRKVRNTFCAKLENNSRSRHARKTTFVPECALDIPAPKNYFFMIVEGKLHTGNDQQVELLRTLLKTIFNGILDSQLPRKQRQSKDGQITVRIKLDFHKCYTIRKPVSKALTSISFVKVTHL